MAGKGRGRSDEGDSGPRTRSLQIILTRYPRQFSNFPIFLLSGVSSGLHKPTDNGEEIDRNEGDRPDIVICRIHHHHHPHDTLNIVTAVSESGRGKIAECFAVYWSILVSNITRFNICNTKNVLCGNFLLKNLSQDCFAPCGLAGLARTVIKP